MVANLPSDLSGVSLTLEPKPRHRSVCHHSDIWMRTPHKGITSLTISYDETVSREDLSLLGHFLPSLEALAVHSSWRPFPLESLSECLPNLKSLGFGSSELYRENDILTVGPPSYNNLFALNSSYHVAKNCCAQLEGVDHFSGSSYLGTLGTTDAIGITLPSRRTLGNRR